MYFQTVAKIWVDSLQENRVKLIHSHCFVQRNFGLVVKASHLLLVEYLSCMGSGPVKVPVVSFSKKLDPYCLVLVYSKSIRKQEHLKLIRLQLIFIHLNAITRFTYWNEGTMLYM